MKLKNRCYTHPVLSDDSDYYSESKFSSDVDLINQGFNIKFIFNTHLKNDEIASYIKHDIVKIVHHIECPKTSYRNAFVTSKMQDETSIPIGMVDDRVEVVSYLVADKTIDAYSNDDFSDDYRGYSFYIPRGCIMAVGNGFKFQITKTHDELKNAASIFSIIPVHDEKLNSMQYYLGDNKILIKLPKKLHTMYSGFSRNMDIQPLMHSMIIIPGLIYVLQILQQEKDNLAQYENRRWFRGLRKACKNQSVDIYSLQDEDVPALAQKLLDNPLGRAFEYLSDDYTEGEDDET